MSLITQKTRRVFKKTIFRALELNLRRFSVLKQYFFALCTVIAILTVFQNAIAESENDFLPTTESIQVFPSFAESRVWQNIDAIVNQDLNETAIFQNFTRLNSSYLDTEVSEPTISTESSFDNVTDKQDAVPESNNDDESTENNTSTFDSENPTIDNFLPEEKQVNTADEQTNEPELLPELNSQNSEPNVPDQSNSADTSQTSVSDPHISTDSALVAFLKKVTGRFSFAQAVLSEPVAEENTGTEPVAIPETGDISEDEPTPTTQEEEPALDAVDSNSILNDDETVLQSEEDFDSETVSVEEAEQTTEQSGQGKQKSKGDMSLTLHDFGVPSLNSGQFINNLQLRLSLAGQYDTEKSLEPASVSIDYSFGEFSGNAGTIFLDKEISNAQNGGYYLIPLPSITDPSLLSKLTITISFAGEKEYLHALYIDSVWLEVGTVTFDKNLLIERFSVDEMLKHLEGPHSMELLSDQLDFEREELPRFNLRYVSQRNFFVRTFRNLIGSNLASINEIVFKNNDGDPIGISPEFIITPDGLLSILVNETDKERLKPGQYTVEVVINEGGYETTDTFEFQWGLLSINSNQTEYSQNDIVEISMGALTPNGNTLCSANLNLYISDPEGFISNPPVVASGQCFGNNVTSVPDFSAQFVAHATGTYEMYLERVDDFGSVLSHTVDTFKVVDNQQVAIERNGPTRIYPPSMYPMELSVHALRSAFAGELIERVPSNFRVFNTDAEIRAMADYTELVWNLDIPAGQSETVSYEFDAPDLSPYLYELGPAQLSGSLEPEASLQFSLENEDANEPETTDTPTEPESGVDSDVGQEEESAGTPLPETPVVSEPESEPEAMMPSPVAEDALPPQTTGETTPPAESEPVVEEEVDTQQGIPPAPEQPLSESLPISFFRSVMGMYPFAQAESIEPILVNGTDETSTALSIIEEDESDEILTVNIDVPISANEDIFQGNANSDNSNVVFIEHREWQIASDATGNMILFWDDGASVPSGWTCLSCGSGAFYQNFIQGNSTYNSTGGAATHTHTASATSTVVSALTTIAAGGSGTTAVTAHTHTMSTLAISSTSTLPRYRQLRVIEYTDAAGEPAVIPAGAIGVFDVASSSLPTGWTRYAAQDGYHIRGENTPGVTSGANTHTHAVTGTTTNAAGGTTGAGGGATGASAAHFHTLSTTTDSVNKEPPYIEVLLGKITADGLPPNNLIAMWTDTVPSGWTDVSSAATSTFNARFLKASTTYGATGGASTHTHANIMNASTSVPSATVTDAGGASGASNVHTHRVNVTGFSSPNHLPPYLTVIFGKRANFNPFYTQNSYRWYVNIDAQLPTDVWPAGGTNIAQGEGITATSSPVKDSEVVRLRINTLVQNATSTTGERFILQYGVRTSTCDAIGSWGNVGAATSSVIWRGYNNATPADHGTLSSTLLTGSTVLETYEENGYATATPNQITVNGYGEWDFVLQNNGAQPGTNYCFRMVKDDSSAFFAYTDYPELITDQVPNTPLQANPFDNAKSTTTRPTFSFYATDTESDRLEYELTIDDSFDFSSPATTTYSFNYPNDAGWASSTFSSGSTTSYTLQSSDALTNGTTYWWRVRTRDPLGSNVWSATSTVWSVTVDTSLSESAWYQTLGLQFEDGTRTNVATTTSTVVLSTTTPNIPTVVSGWSVATVSPGSTLTLTKPSNVEVGDLLLILVGNDNNTANAQWNNTTLKPAGFTLINEAGENVISDAHSAAFYRIADGTETATTSVPAQASADFWGYYIRVTGASTTNPINVTGTDYLGASAASHAVTSITTTQANTLAFYILSADGADTYPFSVSGTGWSESAEVFAGAGGTESAGTWGTRSMASAGATGAATVAFTVNDSASGFQFAINPGNAQGTIMSPEIDFDWVSGQSDWGDVVWNTTEPSGTDIKLRVYYTSTTSCDTIVPDTVLSGNSGGFDASQSGFWLSSISTTTYNRICLKTTLDRGTGTTSPALNDWSVGWVVPNQVPNTPSLALNPAFEYEKSTTTTPTLGGFAATDYESNSLEYQIIVDDDYNLSSPLLTRQSSSYPSDAGWVSATFSAGATTTYTIQPADALSAGSTYWWAVRARDPLGTNTWSATSSVRSITIGSSGSLPEWYQTTNAQFTLDGLANATATSNGVQIETLGSAATNITTQSAWTQQYASGTYPNGTVNPTYSIAAGTNRALVVAIASTRSTAGTQSVGVYYGGVALTQATGDGTNATNVNHTYLFYLNDAGISSATTSVLNVQISGGTSYYTYVYASVFAGVDQTSVYTDARNYFSGATANATVGPFASGLTIGAGDQAVEIVNLSRSAVGNAARTVTTWANATWPNPSTVAAVLTPATNWGVGLHINNRNATTAGTEASGHTANSANTVDSMSGMSLKVAGSGSSGSATSTVIDHDFVSNQDTWGEVAWDVTEPSGSDTTLKVYYATSSTSTCSTPVPNGTLAGNSTGFDVSASPLDISGLSTSTYNRICLVMNFSQGSSLTSPTLNDWAVRWSRTPQFIQQDYKWYQNIDAYTPTDAWLNGGTAVNENEAIDVDGAVLPQDELRLRMSLTASSTNATAGSSSFKLQFAEGATCGTDLTWYDVGDTASTTALWRGYNNPTIADATTLPSTLLTDSDVMETYEERNNSYPNPNAINVGQNAEWDWTLYHNAATPGTEYCFRLVNQDGTELREYNNYPELITNSSPDAPTLTTPFDNEKLASTSPWFEYITNDPEGDEIDFQIQIDDDPAFGSAVIDTESETNLDDFINIENTSDKSPFNNYSRMRYIIPSALANGTTYWWRMRSKDIDGSGSYGLWSDAYSFTIATTTTISTWFQTTEAQFDTDTLEGTDATAANLVSFASGSTTGTTTSTAIDFSDGTTGNAWGSFSFTETGAANDILYHLEYYADGEWGLIPDSALPGNTAGYDTSPVDIIDLDSSTYDIIRIRANWEAGSPTLLDWTVTWGERVSVATHIDPFDNEKFSTTTPTFTFYSTDPQNQELEYEISWSTDNTFATGSTTRNSSSSAAGFTNLTTGGDTQSPYISGDTIAYKVQSGDALSASTTYWWRVRAKDPDFGNSFSFWSDPWSFTTATTGESIAVSTWHQTLGTQFEEGTLTGVIAASGSVEIGGGITLESGWTSNTIQPGNSLTLTKPTGVESGDLLLILVGNDNNTATAQWNNTTLKPSGFTLINTAGNATPDAHVAAFYRVADGTENTTINVPAQSNFYYWGYYIRLTGVDTTNPIDVTGADFTANNITTPSNSIPSITTTADQALAFYVLSADGGDTYPFSVTGSGWVEQGEIQAGTLANNAAGTWGTQEMGVAGATGNATVTMAVADGVSAFMFSLKPAALTSGVIKSPSIDFDDGSGPAWGQLLWRDIELGGSEILYQLEYLNGSGAWELIPNSALSGNSTGFTTAPINLENLNTSTYNELRIVGNLDCNGATCPILNEWTLEWSRGFSVSGTALEYDGVSSTTAGTVAVAVNGTLQLGKTGTIQPDGTWTIDDVTFFSGNTVTVFVSGAADADEAVAITEYDGTPDISGMRLQKRHITIGSDDRATVVNADIGLYDNTNDEDLFHNIDGGNDLTLCVDSGCGDAGIVIQRHNTYALETGADVITHDYQNNGTFTSGNNTIRVSGSWDDNATSTLTGSTIIFTASTTTETIDESGATTTGFNTVTFGESSGTATWNLSSSLDVNGDLNVTYGTLSRNTQLLTVAGNLTTSAGGYWNGIGTTTFDGINPSTWTDANTTKQNIGRVVVDGTSKTLLLGSNATMTSMMIGANDIFDLSVTGFSATVYGDWVNLNTFYARTGTVYFAATSTNKSITAGGDAFYHVNFNGAGGSWSFTEADLTISGNLTIATGTVTMPTGTTTVSGSWSSVGGTFAHNNATVLFNASSAKTITASGTPFTNAFYNLTFTGSGSWSFNDTHATTSNNVTITQGTLTMPGSTLSVGGNFINSGGSFAHNSGTVKFIGSGIYTIDTNASFSTLLFAGSGSWSFVDANVTALGSLTVQNGTTTLPSGTLTLGGSLINSALLAHNGGTVLFNSSDTGETIQLGSSSLYNMTFNSGTGGWTIASHATTTNNTTITSVSSFTLAPDQTLAVFGTFTNSVGGASTTWATTSVLSLEAGNYSLNTKTNTGDAYGTIRVKANTDIKMWNSTSTAYVVDGTGSLYSQDHNATDGSLYIFGGYERSSGTEYWNYGTDFDGTALSATTSRQARIYFADGASALFGTSTLSITGTSTASTTITNQGSGTYSVSVLNGTTTASYYDFANLTSVGLLLSGTTHITTLSNGRFIPSVSSGSGLTVSSTTIDANPALQIHRVTFSTTTNIAAYNVSQIDGTPTSYWWFRESAGNIGGEYFDNDTGDPGSIRWDDSSLVITVSGTVYESDEITPMGSPTCDGATPNIKIVVEGGGTHTGFCDSVDGTFSILGVVVVGDPVMTVYLDTNGGAQGTVVTKTPTANITDFDIYENRVVTRHEDVEPMTILDMAVFDNDNDTDIRYRAATGTLTVLSNTELHIASSTTFDPDGDITIEGNASSTAFDGSLHIDNDALFTGSGTSTYSVAGSFMMDEGAQYTPASTTVIMTATTTGKTVTTATGQEISFNNLQFTGINGGWNINSDIESLGSIIVSTGTVTGTGDITVVNGSISGNGTLSMGMGTTTLYRTNTLGGDTPWTFANLVLGNGSVTGTTTFGSVATTTILGKLTISTGHYLSAGGSIINLTGSGNVFVESGTFLEATSTVRYGGTGGSNVLSTTYYNLETNGTGGTQTYTATGLGIIVSNNLTVGGTATSTLTLDTNDPALDVNGNVYIASRGTLVGSGSGTFTVAGNWDNDGTFTGSGGTVTLDGSGAQSIAAGASSFSSLRASSTGSITVTENATSTGTMTLYATGGFTVQSGLSFAVGGTFANNVSGAATTWTGSTLYLYGNGNYQVNASTTNDSYETLRIGGTTQIRMWNSSATTYDVSGTASLYSQDHTNIPGDLYIFGAYVKTSGTDYWSYATDFDGGVLGSPRIANVRIGNGSSVLYTGGGLSIVGSPSATTTIANQGVGTYAMRIGGNASTTMSYYSFVDMNVDGITFSGTPNVVSLSNGAFTVGVASGTAMSVGGTVITQNPAKTFTNNNFSTTTGVSGFNVTATGTAASSWRFTNHSGSIDGEAHDIDPDEDPGYVVWDDSSANITISGTVYSGEGSGTSGACDGLTENIHIRVAGLTSYTGTCDAGDGTYSIPGILYSPGDSFIVYIDGESEKAATVSEDPVSSVSGFDLYENRVIVRHESTDPLSIADMSLWDSSDDADIPFTANDGAPDTLTLPADRKLIVWTGKEFEPNGNVTISGGGGGSAYDGTLELFNSATFDATGSEAHTIGGSLIMGSSATLDDETSTFTFTTSGAARTIDTNENNLYNVTLNGSGSWTVTNTNLQIANDFTITQGSITLPTGTTTVGGSISNTGGSLIHNGGSIEFTSGAAETIRLGGSSVGTTTFSGSGSWTYLDTNATTTGDFIIRSGAVTAASGTLTIGNNFKNSATFTHNSGTLRLISSNANATITANGSDLYSVTIAGSAHYRFTDTNVALLGSLRILQGSTTLATGTMSIAGSFQNLTSFSHASGTILFNSSDVGETINSGNSPFNAVTVAAPSGGYTITGSATSTGNFALSSVSSFTLQSGLSLNVEGVFTNLVGGANTTWTGSTLRISSNAPYTINTSTQGGDVYNILQISDNSDLRMWNSSATTTIEDSGSSLYSMDHGGVNGELNIYGNYERTTGSDYWSYTTDFDGTNIAGSPRIVTVRVANAATTTFSGGALNIIGTAAATTTVTNQGSGTYHLNVTGGTLDAQYYAFRNMDAYGLVLDGETVISSLSHGDYELAVNGGALMTVGSTTINYNATHIITGARFATTTAITGTNVEVVGTTASAWTFTGHTGNLDGEAFDNDGGTDCGSIRWEDSTCLLTEQSAYRWRNNDGGEGVPDSEWYDQNWVKRKRVTVTNSDATTYTNAVVELTVSWDSDMQADFDDLRFTASDGITPLNHFRETYTGSTQAVVWVQIPSLAANADTEIYMYYGYGTVSDGSATTTFIAMDTFEDGNISEYAGPTSEFSVVGSSAYERTYRLEASDQANSKTEFGGIYNNSATVSQGQTLRFMQYINTATGSSDETCTLFATQGLTANYAVCLELFGVDRMSIARNVLFRDQSGTSTVLASTTVTYTTGWYEVEVDWGTNNSIYASLYKDDTLIATTSASDSTYTTGGVGFALWGYHGGWDAYSSRPLLATEPTTTFGGEQVPGGATWLSSLNTAATGVDVGSIIRPRFLIENTGLTVSDAYRLAFAVKGNSPSCESVNTSLYGSVPPQSLCDTEALCMATSTEFANEDPTTDLLGGDGTFTAGQIIQDPSNTTQSLSLDGNEFTEVEYAVLVTTNATSSSYCLKVTDAGSNIDSYARVAELRLTYAPTISTLNLNDGANIILLPGTTTRIYATGTVSDLNGYDDIVSATTTFYQNGLVGGVGYSCTPDNNNCYRMSVSASSCSFVGCSGNSCDVICYADMYYHTNSTNAGIYAGDAWTAFIDVEDAAGYTATATSPSIDVETLRSVSADELVDYGSLEVDSDTGSNNASTTFTNIGNVAVDLAIEGTDLSDGVTSIIPVDEQRFATSTFTYSACVYCTQLSTTSINYELDLAKPASTTPSIVDELFWGIAIPYGVSSSEHRGDITFYPIDD